MRVLVTSTSGTGHLQPLLPYAAGLAARGHDVRIASREDHAERVARAGHAHIVFDRPPAERLEALWARARAAGGPDETLAVYVTDLFAGISAEAALPKLGAALADWPPDLVLRESAEFAGLVAARAAGVPHVRVEVHNPRFEEEMMMARAGPPVAALLRGAGLAAPAGVLEDEPALTGFPAAFDPPRDRATRRRVRPLAAAAVAADAPARWIPRDGRPLLYMTFGTVAAGIDSACGIYRTALAAAAGLPAQVLLTTGTELAPEMLGPVPANVTVEPFVPQEAVFAHARGVVCHGGSGTVLGALAAGLPLAVTPLFADQPSNAACIAAAGAGLVVPDATPGSLRAAIARLLAEPDFAARARAIADELASAPPLDAALDALEALAG